MYVRVAKQPPSLRSAALPRRYKKYSIIASTTTFPPATVEVFYTPSYTILPQKVWKIILCIVKSFRIRPGLMFRLSGGNLYYGLQLRASGGCFATVL